LWSGSRVVLEFSQLGCEQFALFAYLLGEEILKVADVGT